MKREEEKEDDEEEEERGRRGCDQGARGSGPSLFVGPVAL